MKIIRESFTKISVEKPFSPKTVAKYDNITTTTAHQLMVKLATEENDRRRSENLALVVSPDILSGRSVVNLVDRFGTKYVQYRQFWADQPKPEVLPYRHLPDEIDNTKPAEVRHNLPYKKGDIIYTEGEGGPRIVQVQLASYELRDSTGDYIDKYRVASLRPDGSFGRGRRWVYPGDIQRGYKQANLPCGME